jgi:anaerobic selenocysteine-containing dehydrogenase
MAWSDLTGNSLVDQDLVLTTEANLRIPYRQKQTGGIVMEAKEGTYISSCGLDCGSRCLLKVQVEGGRITRITNDDQPGPGLKACARGLSQREVLYAGRHR